MARGCILLLYDLVLVLLAIEDQQKRKIRNLWNWLIAILAFAAVFVMPEISLKMRGMGIFMVSVPMILLTLLFPGSFGGGDVKLVIVCGMFLGWKLLLQGTTTAMLLAGSYSFWKICTTGKGENMQFALGPFLSTGFLLVSLTLF